MPERILPRPVYNIVSALLILVALAITSCPVMAQGRVKVAIHYVEGLPAPSKTEYQVNAYLSVYDLDDDPIANIEKSALSVTEDGQKVNATSFEKASNIPASLIVLVDTSDSMGGEKLENVRDVLGKFVGQLGANDRTAVYTFNDTPNLIIDFDLPRQEASGMLNQINTAPGTGTCLYDAVHTAVQKAGTLPPGKRALILVTDGNDQRADGAPCSAHTTEEITFMASSGITRIPLYVVGIGDDIDRQVLNSLADSTGGNAFFPENERLLDSMFSRLIKELKVQYVLRYTSHSMPGEHKLAVVVNHSGAKAQNDRSFTLRDMNTTLSILTPTQGEEVSGVVKITADIQGGEQVGQVKLLINGTDSAVITSAPYTFDWDFQNSPAGTQTITLVASGMDGSELAAASTIVVVVAPQAQVSPTVLLATSTPQPAAGSANTTLFLGAGVAILGIFVLVAGAVVFILLRRKSKSAVKVAESPMSQVEKDNVNVTRISKAPSSGALATLEVLFSDDTAMTGRVFEITKPGVMIGRSLDCDFIFPQDTPISRAHVIIELRDGEFFISEMVSQDADGSVKRPKFGTFVNEKSLEGPSALKNGDIIRLGPRARFRFDQFYSAAKSIEETIDLSMPADLLKTFDSTDMSTDEKTVDLDSARGDLAETLVSPSGADQLEKTIELPDLPGAVPIKTAPDPDKTLMIDEAPVPKLHEVEEMAPALPPLSSSQDLAQKVLEKPAEEAGDMNDRKTLDDINIPFSADHIAPLNEDAATFPAEDNEKTMEDILSPLKPEDLEKTLEDIVIPPALQPSPSSGTEVTLDDISFDDSGKTLDDIPPVIHH